MGKQKIVYLLKIADFGIAGIVSEEKFLMNNNGKINNDELCIALNRTPNSIRQKVMKLGLKR